ncbi:cathepsin O-like [Asterias rubens]|uniref:cathepsin O-like n=1 Tax=Asterias rubens TaxID=7604 RepID=UPI001455A750|nr:cathepsin O-like [Asterias rubens]
MAKDKVLEFVIVFMVLSCQLASSTSSIVDNFNQFILKYERSYVNGSSEYQKRLGYFKASLGRHEQLNSLRVHPEDAIFGVTRYSDLSPEEFAATVLGKRSNNFASRAARPDFGLVNFRGSDGSLRANKLPLKYSLLDKKPSVLTPVKNQGSCGGCWAFTIVECLETQHALKSGTLYDLSTQQVMDCNNVTGDHGCTGGSLCGTLDWLQKSKEKIVLEKDYPYKGKTETCKHLEESGLVYQKNYTCQSYKDNEGEMVAKLFNHGPLVAAVDATSFQDYMGGIIQHHCTDRYDNHAVQIIGYDRSGDIPYYIIRNSWGTSWGLDGYLYIKIGGNLCGIANTVGSLDTN